MMTNQELFSARHDVSRETIERLKVYEHQLKKWTAKINLISKSTIPEIWTRHFMDSAQVFDAIPKNAKTMSDFGSGGGFPGLVIATLAKEKLPDLEVSLVESDVRKSSFLMTASREMGLDVRVYAERVDAIPKQDADVITARALASLGDLLEMTETHMKSSGTALFLKGAQYQLELDTASQMWDFQLTKQPSATSDESALLAITDLRRAN